MKQISHVFLFELKSILRKRSVIITTLLFAFILFAVTTIPTGMKLYKQFTGDEQPDGDDIISAELPLKDVGILMLTQDVSDEQFVSLGATIYNNQNELKKDIENSDIINGFVIDSPTSFENIVLDRSWDLYHDHIIISILKTNATNQKLIEYDLDVEKVYDAFNVEITTKETILGKNATSNIFISFFLMFAIYMLVIMYGSFVATSVAREKDNRTMEILITSTKPATLIIGKVFANAIGGLAQFGFIIAAGIFGFLLNKVNYPTTIVEGLFHGLTFGNVFVFLLFTAVGYLLYLFLYAALGSLVTKLEDVNSSITPVTLLFMVGYGISAFAMEMPGLWLVKVASFVPFTSILTMPVRNFQTSIPWYELATSMVLMISTTLFLAYLSIKIYRMGSLNYGNKIKIREALKMVFTKS